MVIQHEQGQYKKKKKIGAKWNSKRIVREGRNSREQDSVIENIKILWW